MLPIQPLFLHFQPSDRLVQEVGAAASLGVQFRSGVRWLSRPVEPGSSSSRGPAIEKAQEIHPPICLLWASGVVSRINNTPASRLCFLAVFSQIRSLPLAVGE